MASSHGLHYGNPSAVRPGRELDEHEIYELHVRVVRAQNLTRVISFGKMDPVCVLNTPRATVKTHAAENGDAAPVWDSGHNKFMLLVNARDSLTVTVNHRGIAGDSLVGRAVLSLKGLAHGRVDETLYAVHTAEGDRAGEVLLRMQRALRTRAGVIARARLGLSSNRNPSLFVPQ